MRKLMMIAILSGMLLHPIHAHATTIKKPSKAQCQMLLESLLHNLNIGNYCSTASDCVAVDLGCPFPCDSLINRNEDIARMQALKTSHDNVCPSCQAKCASPKGTPDCVEHKCVYR